MVLQTMFSDVLAGDDTSNTMIVVQNHQVAKTHSAEEAVASLYGGRRIDRVRRRIHVGPYIKPTLLQNTREININSKYVDFMSSRN